MNYLQVVQDFVRTPPWVRIQCKPTVLLALSVHAAFLSLSAIFPACAAAACWAGYILASRRVGNATRGLHGLAVPLSVAAAYPLLPYALENAALRRISSHRFGILTSGEPVVALGVGLVLLGQSVTPSQIVGILVIVAANLLAVGAT